MMIQRLLPLAAALALTATPALAAKSVTTPHLNPKVNRKKATLDRVAVMPVATLIPLPAEALIDIQETINETLQAKEIFTLPLTQEDVKEEDDQFTFESLNRVSDRFRKVCQTGKAPYAIQAIVHEYRTETGALSFTKGKSVVALDLAVCQKGEDRIIYRAYVLREADKDATLKSGSQKKSRMEALVKAVADGLAPLLDKTGN